MELEIRNTDRYRRIGLTRQRRDGENDSLAQAKFRFGRQPRVERAALVSRLEENVLQ